jgi:predicted PurR-regulated permease PerM
MNSNIKFPFYAKASLFLIGLYVLISMLYIAQDIILPLIFSILFAILISPVVNFFVKMKLNRIFAIVITLFIAFLIIASFSFLIFSQASRFIETWPILVDKFTDFLNQTITWTSGYFDIKPQNIHEWISETRGELINTGSSAIGQTLVILGNWVVVLLLVPFYIFIILYYQPLLMEFIHRLFAKSNQTQLSEIVLQIKSVIQLYLKGLVVETIIVAAMQITTLWILGIEYAILLGIIGALLNLIPYIGGLVAVALPMMVALVTKSTAWYAFYIMVIYYIIQLIDNNYIVPVIVSSKVKINALFSIIVVIAGNALWGISGMFLAIPLLAIIKIIFDHIESLKPWGFLLGFTMGPKVKLKGKVKVITT